MNESYLKGHTRTPNRLIANAGRLGLKPEHLALVLAIESFHFGDSLPRPSVSTLADMLGRDERSVRRWADELERAGKLEKRRGYRNRISWDLAPLFCAVEALTLDRTDSSELNPGNVDNCSGRTDVSGLNGSSSDNSVNPDRTDVSEVDRTDSSGHEEVLHEEVKEEEGGGVDTTVLGHGQGNGCFRTPFKPGTIYDQTFQALGQVWLDLKGSVPRLNDGYVSRFMKVVDTADSPEDLAVTMRARIAEAQSFSFFVPVWEDGEHTVDRTFGLNRKKREFAT